MPSKITIITVSYNAECDIEKTIQSVINQTYDNIEYIIVDGASKDGTMQVVEKYKDKITKIVSEPDNGLYDALNKGVSLASGEWIGIMNCGDVFSSCQSLSEMFDEIIPDSVDVIYGDCRMLFKGNLYELIAQEPCPGNKLPPDYRHGASFIRASYHKQHLYSIEERSKYGYALDFLHIYRMHKTGAQFMHRRVFVLDYQKEGMSDNPWKNKYLRGLIQSDGKKNINFYCIYCGSIVKALIHKFLRYGFRKN